MCFCWLLLAFLGFFASAAFFVCAFAGFCWLFFGFLRPRRYLYVLLLVLSGFSWVFCVRGDICMCFCWLFLGFWRPRRFLYVLLLAFVWFFGARGDSCMAFVGFFGVRVELWLKQVSYRIPVPMLYSSLWLKDFCLLNQMPKQIAKHRFQKAF